MSLTQMELLITKTALLRKLQQLQREVHQGLYVRPQTEFASPDAKSAV